MVVVLVVLTSALFGCSSHKGVPRNARAVADEIAAAFGSQRFDEVEAIEVPQAKEVLAAGKLRSLWHAAVTSLGSYLGHGDPVVADAGPSQLFDYPLTFRRGRAHLQVALNQDSRVTGLVLLTGDPTGRFGR
jgi:hypothetical protein